MKEPGKENTNSTSIKTDDYTIIVNGHVVGSVNDEVPDEPGGFRYVQVNGVADCFTFAYQGTRADGKVATLVMHISSRQYEVRAPTNTLPPVVERFKPKVQNLNAIAVTNY
jgi:hypothetical protein